MRNNLQYTLSYFDEYWPQELTWHNLTRHLKGPMQSNLHKVQGNFKS